jgi:aspartate racemase
LRVIGVLGGIGPESTAEFYRRLINRIQKKGYVQSNLNYPHILINSIPAPELFLENLDLSMYREGVCELERWGAEFIVIVCNTAHLYLLELQEEIRIPIIDLVEEVDSYLTAHSVSSITVAGSSRTVKQNLFTFKNRASVPLSEEDLKLLDEVILQYNSGMKVGQLDQILRIVSRYNVAGNHMLVGCTELSTIFASINLPIIDTMDILVDATIEKWRS